MIIRKETSFTLEVLLLVTVKVAEILPIDFLQTPGNYYLLLIKAKIQR